MIDWHSHILPGMDDGSKNTEESLNLINMLREQNVDIVIATPHFFANDESVQSFLSRRQKSLAELQSILPESSPRILTGAEVKYYPGISRMSDLRQLQIESTGLLLLEMPMSRWTDYTVDELNQLACIGDLKIILAHIERYLSYQSADVFERLSDSGVLMQANATYFTEFASRRKALRMLGDGKIQFVGSDTHNTSTRPPYIKKAFDVIQKKFGGDFINQMNEYGYSLLVQK